MNLQAFFTALLVCGALVLLPAAATQAQPKANSSKPATPQDSKITNEELNELTNGYADRYMTYIVNAAQQIELGNPNAEQRRLINQVQLVQVSSVYDIVTTADPLTQLIDLTLVVTLQSKKWIDDDEAEKSFGERGQHLIDASRRAREDIWKLAARVLKPEQLEQLDLLITEWHKNNPDIKIVSYVRFDDFASTRGKSVLSDVRAGGGFLASVDEAKKSVDEVRLLAERAFYLGKRLPFMMNWHVKAAVSDALSEPGLQQIQAAVPQITDSVNRVTASVEKIPDQVAKERVAILDALNQQQPFIQATLQQVRGTVQDSDKLAGSALKVTQSVDGLLKQVNQTNAALNSTMKTLDQTFIAPGRNVKPDPNAKPFDIAQYTQSAAQFTTALQEANGLLGNASQLLQSPAIGRQALLVTTQGTELMNAALLRAMALVAFFFVMLAAYRLFVAKALSPGSSGSKG